MNPSDQERLWRELFPESDLEEMRRASLAKGMAASRSRRRRRQALSASLVVLLLGLATVALQRRPLDRPSPPPRPAPAQVVAGVKRIDDRQLLALFPDRPVALIGPIGAQRLVFLDGAK